MVNGKTQLAGVMGWPVSHSRSPLMHNYWCQEHHVNGVYVPLPVAPNMVETALRGLAAAGFRGVNVTIPHKEVVYRACDELTAMAQRAGAVNTVRFEQGKIIGDCTDGTGFCDNLQAHHIPLKGCVLILGAGGAARAIAAALLDRGCSVLITNRSEERARALVEALGEGEVVPWDEWPRRLKDVQLLVNATSLGMGGVPGLEWFEALANGHDGLAVADIVYTPRQTPLIKAARQRGWQTVDGLGMLIYQARAGFHQWFGVMPEITEAVFNLLVRDLNLEAAE
ncbi:shikimate dehydrogenase [Saccharibacter sp. 17.LH.SD]|uniref:shikimate dehydrogenase n=1 Tax=Saccharibacter sp. 17.LH.SD TaxID=2689393 RepID=UPI00136D44D6|nr:shikimate dehydrogenase [Saccharibacter sp. 17.LH.SD]MXV44546.1 shikimate dehydrogenase [Saccharibacter sp. 17.LH.SD]